jgi:hypothetical protein
MFSSISRSIELVKQSWKVLTLDREILLFPLLSGVAIVLLLLSFLVPALIFGVFTGYQTFGAVTLFIGMFLFYLIAYFIMIFFNVGLVTCAQIRLTGGDPTFRDGIRNASAHLPQIIVWAVISATIGLLLRILAERFGLIAQILTAIIGTLWSLITYFVVPVMIFQNKGVIDAISESAGLFKKTWGETVVGQVSIGLIFLLLGLAGAVPLFLAFISGFPPLFIVVVGICIIYFVALVVVSSSLQGIFNTALYLYATTGRVPEAYSKDLVAQAFQPKLTGGMRGNI